MKAYLLAFCLGMVFPAVNAGAADLYTPEPQPYQPPAVSESSNWYLRGDVGYGFDDLRGVEYQTPGAAEFDTAKVKDSFLIGIGAGYQLTHHLRFDVTGDYTFRKHFRGTTSGTCVGGGACTSVESGDGASLLTLLANAYVDLGTWHGVTPYVGAGLGATHVDWGGFNSVTTCTGAACGAGTTTTSYNGESSWRFTYALMAGASVDLSCNLKFDAGYRYRHVNGGAMFSGLPGITGGRDKGFDIHEVRGGLRYSFGGCDQPQYASYEPAPVYK